MILITGGMGFIGIHTARRFLDAGEEVILTQRSTRRDPEFLRDQLGKRLHVESLDVRDRAGLDSILKKHRVTDIAHLVAPPLNTVTPDDDFNTGVLGLLNVLQAGKEAGVHRVTLASSIGVYGSFSHGPFREDMPLPMDSRTPTETFKKSWEILGLHYADRTGLDVRSMRIGSIWGPIAWQGMVPAVRLCQAALTGNDLSNGPEMYEGDESTPCYVYDCVAGIELLQHAEGLNHRIYNLGATSTVTNREITDAIRKVIPDFQPKLLPGTGPRNRPDSYMAHDRIAADVGYGQQYDIDRAVAHYIEWVRAHPGELPQT